MDDLMLGHPHDTSLLNPRHCRPTPAAEKGV